MLKPANLTDVQARRAEIAKIKGALDSEDAELAIAERVLTRLSQAGAPEPGRGHAQSTLLSPVPLPPAPLAPPPPAPPAAEAEEDDGLSLVDTIKESMSGRETLEELIEMMFDECRDDWWTAGEVQHHLTLIKGREVPMSSVSPTLTKMKDSGVIVRDGLKVALAKRVKTNEAAAE